MRKTLAAAAVLFAFGASAGSIRSIDKPSIQTRSGEHFMTVTGAGLGSQILYDGPTGRQIIDVNYADPNGYEVTAWIPLAIINTPGLYTLQVLGGTGDTEPVGFEIFKPGRPTLSLHVPDVLTALAKTRSGAYIKYEATVTGGDGYGTVNCEPASGSLFPFGKSYVRCVASDQSGGQASDTIDVNVWDGVAPTLTLPTPPYVGADNERGAYVKFDTSAYDDVDGALGVSCSHQSGAFFPNGKTRVTCEAVDLSLNPAYGSFEVFVKPWDPGRLQLAVPSEVVEYTDSEYEAVVYYKVDAYGSADPDPVVTCSQESGSVFAIGETKVYCLAEDDFGARAEGAFYVVVKRLNGLMLADTSAEAVSPEGAPVTFDTEAEGWVDGITCSHDSGSMFAIGTTKVTCEAGGKKGAFNVIVADTVAPHIANIRAKQGAVDETGVTVQVEVDAVDAADAMPRCSIASLSAEGEPGAFDWRITSDLEVQVRNGNSFRLAVSCVDAAGNRASGSIPVRLTTTPGGGRRRAAH